MRRSACLGLAALLAATGAAPSAIERGHDPIFTLQEVMIPVRDGVHLQTVILTPDAPERAAADPVSAHAVRRARAKRRTACRPSLKELAQDGYIFVIQNLRGRFKSEGVFKLSSQVDLQDPKATNETTDAYDSIDWLVKNVPNNSGKVGMYGVSYDGLTTAMTLLHPHPALEGHQRAGVARSTSG